MRKKDDGANIHLSKLQHIKKLNTVFGMLILTV